MHSNSKRIHSNSEFPVGVWTPPGIPKMHPSPSGPPECLYQKIDTALKDLIKDQPYSRYDANKRTWLIPLQDKERLLEAIEDYCVDNNILVDDIPPFVDQVLRTTIPFGKAGSKFNKTHAFNYEAELREQKKDVSMLPKKISENLYEF